jgi:hypothetical protein
VSWWNPSGRRGPMAKPKLILVCDRTLMGIGPILVCGDHKDYFVAKLIRITYCQSLLWWRKLLLDAPLPPESD